MTVLDKLYFAILCAATAYVVVLPIVILATVSLFLCHVNKDIVSVVAMLVVLGIPLLTFLVGFVVAKHKDQMK